MAPNEIYKITIYLALINYWIHGNYLHTSIYTSNHFIQYCNYESQSVKSVIEMIFKWNCIQFD